MKIQKQVEADAMIIKGFQAKRFKSTNTDEFLQLMFHRRNEKLETMDKRHAVNYP